jgi:4-oxalocrotonate tautomerase
MPTVRIEMWSGRTLDQKRSLVQLVTKAIVEALGVPSESVIIKLAENEKSNASRGGVLRSEE